MKANSEKCHLLMNAHRPATIKIGWTHYIKQLL